MNNARTPKRRCLGTAFWTGLALLLLLGAVVVYLSNSRAEKVSWNRVHVGMTLTKAIEIMGPPVAIEKGTGEEGSYARNESSVSWWAWNGTEAVKVEVFVRDEIVIGKSHHSFGVAEEPSLLERLRSTFAE